ncbi:MAG: LysR family transcriptional regulator [Bradyrhizobium sp.]|nr:LysR family transcriptional regulator [Bradyrhizobium sp.]
MDYFEAMTAFVRSAELGSFSKAAAESGAKVSTVSRHVSGLEADLGAALFNRSTRRLHLTEAGRMFFERAKEILADVENALDATRSLNDRPKGLLRINVPLVFGRRHVMAHMRDFLDRYPDIRLEAMLTETTVDLIEAGADVAVRIGALVDSTLVARKLAPLRRVLAASPRYLHNHSAPQKPEDLRRHECLLYALHPTAAWYYRHARDPTDPIEVPVQGRLRANDIESLREGALSGFGIALLPTWLVGSDLREQQLVEVLPDFEWLLAPGPERAIWAVYPPKKVVSPKVRAFIGFLSECFGQPPYWEKP